MPHTTSAKKNLRKADKRRLHNRATKKAIKVQLKEFATALEEGTAEAAQKEYNLAAKRLDKAAARGVIHRNMAARKKSQLALALRKKLGDSPPAPAGTTPPAAGTTPPAAPTA